MSCVYAWIYLKYYYNNDYIDYKYFIFYFTGLSDHTVVKLIGKKPTKSGENLTMTCEVEGTEPISIQWFR